MHPRSARAFAAIALAASLTPAPAPAHPYAPPSAAALSAAGAFRVKDRIVLRLRPEVARTAWQERAGRTAAGPDRLSPAPVLDALARRISARRLEPEFPGEAPGRTPDLAAFWIARLDGSLPLESALAAASASAEVLEATPVTRVPIDDPPAADVPPRTFAPGAWASPGAALAAPVPNDSLWGLCYWLEQPSRRDLHAREAWAVTTGDSSSVIAVIDTGVLRWHPDLAGTIAGRSGNLWTNAAEQNGLPGVDDDLNGYVDDTWGWDFVDLDSASEVRPGEDWRDPDNDPEDFAVHGTAVSGVAAGLANNVHGALGVAPGARIMALRAGYSAPTAPTGYVDMTWAAQAIVYAVRNGATVINCSFGTVVQPDLGAAADAATAAGVTIVTAAGNGLPLHYLGQRPDVISVAATDASDKITRFSTLADWVDLAAPGQSIATTILKPTGTDSIGLRTPSYSPGEAGTSFSSPMVAGAVALLQADRREHGQAPLPPDLVQLRIVETTDDISALNPGGGYGSGRLNLERMLTDPHVSHGLAVGAATVGSGVIVPGESGGARIAHVTTDAHFVVWDPVSGDTLTLAPLGGTPAGGLAAADVGGATGDVFFVALEDGRIAGLDLAGTPLPGWPVSATGTRGSFEMLPGLADLDGDGIPEVLWGGNDGNVWAWRLDGTNVAGFPKPAGIAGENLRLALGDLDGAPGAEIVVAGNDDSLRVLGGDGAIRPGWPVFTNFRPEFPILLRFASGEPPTIVTGAGSSLQGFRLDGSPVFLRDYFPSVFAYELSAADLRDTGHLQLITPTLGVSRLLEIDPVQGLLASRNLAGVPAGAAIVGPLAAGANAQVVLPVHDPDAGIQCFAFDDTLGPLRGWPKAGHPSGSLSLGDLDADGSTEVDAGSGNGATLYLYEAATGSWRPGAAAWPTPRANAARTSSLLETPVLGTVDDVAPDAVNDLEEGVADAHEVALSWHAPADPGSSAPVAAYDLRVSTAPLDARNFTAARAVPFGRAPASPGALEQLEATGLDEGVTQWIALRSRDVAGNWSPVSNLVEVSTPVQPPAGVGDLRVTAGTASSLTFAWTATGEDGRVGRPAGYRIRLAPAPLDSAAFEAATLGADVAARVDAGGGERAVVTGLTDGARLWASLRAVDSGGHLSPLSNAVETKVGRLAGTSGVRVLAGRAPSPVPVALEWRGGADAATSRQEIQIFDVGGRRVRTLPLPAAPSGVARWDGADREGRTVREGVYFVRLVSGAAVATTRIVLLR